MNLTDTEELFLAYIDEGFNLKETAEKMEVDYGTTRKMHVKLKEVILERARDKLALAVAKAVNTTIDTLDADASTEKGELKLKAAESIMDRSGLTKHTNVEVQVESENGLFILPAKVPTASEAPEED